MNEAVELAWGIIANAYGGDWSWAAPDWRKAAERWRDKYVTSPCSKPTREETLEALRHAVTLMESEADKLRDFEAWGPEQSVRRRIATLRAYLEGESMSDDKKSTREDPWAKIRLDRPEVILERVAAACEGRQARPTREEALAALVSIGCGDSSCLIGLGGRGMRTNGGCRCLPRVGGQTASAVRSEAHALMGEWGMKLATLRAYLEGER